MSKKNAAVKKTGLDADALYFIPLGGSEQFGVNLNVYAAGGQILVVDCGLGFAGESYPGIDLLLPDPAWLEERRAQIQGLVVTHAHEDHVGAVAYLWPRLKCPVYTTRFTAAVLERKLEEAGLRDVPVHIVDLPGAVRLGHFGVEFIPVSHSIPDAAALVIETPHGRVLHSGDWNLDPRPVVGPRTEAAPFQRAGEKGILAYIGDSTNAGSPGRAGSESDVEQGLEQEFRAHKGRVAVTIFSSNIGRIKSIARAARASGRSVAVLGRSLHQMISAARACGYMEGVPEFLREEDLEDLAPGRTALIVTGSQGEPRSALAKIARGEFRSVTLGKGDTVIFSARAIPGNEKAINAVRNNLCAAGVDVVTPDDTANIIHVSGHPCRDEIIDMYGWVRPRTVVPVHGERTQLGAQAALARSCQIENVVIPRNGSVIRLAPGAPAIEDHIPVGLLAVDQKRLIPADHASIGERRKLQYSGAVHVSLALDEKGNLLAPVQLDTLGLIDQENAAEMRIENKLRQEVLELLDELNRDELKDDHFVTEELRIGLRRFIFHALGFKPKTTVHVIRVQA